ncbi:hypothetical protein [Parabacteroides sp.]|uniref:hypothetical protein n=1 Tax=Parabacteroides sp. TaxID=1869337 RepID=UPI00257FC665|nr:hypothetical protein [Parabacteroides sp.]
MKTILHTLVAMIALAVTSCNNDDNEAFDILRPISENVIGRWQQTNSYQLDANGNKIEDGAHIEGMIIQADFRPDGTAIELMTTLNGWQRVNKINWTADEKKRGIHFAIEDGDPHFCSLQLLTDNQMIQGMDSAYNSQNGEMVKGNFRFEYQRVPDEPILSEQMIGKWATYKTYQKVDGEWQEVPNCCPEEGWFHFLYNGVVDHYVKFGDWKEQVEMQWLINVKTNRMNLTMDDRSVKSGFAFLGTDTLELYNDASLDFSTGQMVLGEFKDVLLREK